MWRWIAGSAGLVVMLTVGVMMILFFTARSPLAEDLNEVEKTLINEYGVHTIHELDYYHGEGVVYIALTVNESGEREWLFLQDQNIVGRVMEEDTLSFNEAKQLVMERFDLSGIRSIKTGYENDQPIYEITFERDGRFHYYYMSMVNGEFIKRYSMKKS